MTSTLVGLVAGVAVAAGLWRLAQPWFALPVFLRAADGRRIPTSLGALTVLTTLVVNGWYALVSAATDIADAEGYYGRRTVLVAVLAFGFLGLLTDLADVDDEATSGTRTLPGVAALRWVLGAAAALTVAIALPRPATNELTVLLDALLVALAANLGSRLAEAPGRATKVGLAGALPLLGPWADQSRLAGLGLVAGASAVLLRLELAGRGRIGDVGGAVLGASLGAGVCLATGVAGRSAVLAALIAVSVVAELGWLERAFEAPGPLRAFDRWGRRSPPT